MTIYAYDEASNIAQLQQLPLRLKVLFALLAALRILPAYGRFNAKTGRGDAAALQELADRLWLDVIGQPMTDAEARASADRALALVPLEDDGWDEETQAYAEDAAAALAYAFRVRVTDDPQEAAWAARRVYEAADHLATTTSALAVGAATNERVILSHPVVQAELTRQRRDLQEVAELARRNVIDKEIAQLRARSEAEAASFFGGSVGETKE